MEKMKTSSRKRVSPRFQREVILLRSAVTSLIGGDLEGEYRPAFVAEILGSLSEPATEEITTGVYR